MTVSAVIERLVLCGLLRSRELQVVGLMEEQSLGQSGLSDVLVPTTRLEARRVQIQFVPALFPN